MSCYLISLCNYRGSSCCICCWYVCLQSSLWSLTWKSHGKTLKLFLMYYYHIQIHTHTCSTVSPLGWLFIFRLFPLDYRSRPLGQSPSFQVQFSFSLMHLVLSNSFQHHVEIVIYTIISNLSPAFIFWAAMGKKLFSFEGDVGAGRCA